VIALSRFFKVAYVTRDSTAQWKASSGSLGIREFQFTRGNQLDKHTRIDFALAWLREVMIELIQPRLTLVRSRSSCGCITLVI
jgi:hypothetical protein